MGMQRVVWVLMLVIASKGVIAQSNDSKGSVIVWDKSAHDFGDVYQGNKVQHRFRFTNASTEPLLINNVEVTCGCTIPNGWTRDPIMPGKRGEIDVLFDSTGKNGKQNKVVTIISTLGNSQITFSANVIEKKPK
jgi:hypothetical protein